MEEFVKNPAHFGATVGRTANRIKNGAFTLNEKNDHLPLNDGKNRSRGGNLDATVAYHFDEDDRIEIAYTLRN